MSFLDKAKDKAQQLAGVAKQKAGKATGNEQLQAEGKADQTGANLKQAGENVKDAFKYGSRTTSGAGQALRRPAPDTVRRSTFGPSAGGPAPR